MKALVATVDGAFAVDLESEEVLGGAEETFAETYEIDVPFRASSPRTPPARPSSPSSTVARR